MSTTPSTPEQPGGPAGIEEMPAAVPADLQDERLIASRGVKGAVSAFTSRLRSGDLGSLPVVVGLVIIWGVFQSLNTEFLSARNLVNLTLQSAAVGTIAIGIVLVLLLGEIDLSVGSVSGLAAAILGVTLTSPELAARPRGARRDPDRHRHRAGLRRPLHPLRGAELRHHPGGSARHPRRCSCRCSARTGSINIAFDLCPRRVRPAAVPGPVVAYGLVVLDRGGLPREPPAQPGAPRPRPGCRRHPCGCSRSTWWPSPSCSPSRCSYLNQDRGRAVHVRPVRRARRGDGPGHPPHRLGAVGVSRSAATSRRRGGPASTSAASTCRSSSSARPSPRSAASSRRAGWRR